MKAQDQGLTWGGALRAGALGIAASMVFLAVVGLASGIGVNPIIIVIGVLFCLGALWQARARGGLTFVLVIALLWFVLNMVLFGGILSLARPASWAEFTVAVATIAATVVVVMAYRGGRRAGFNKAASNAATIVRGAAGVTALALVVGLLATFTAHSDAVHTGDIPIAAKSFKFDQKTLTAQAGKVTVYFKNADPSQHDFTIDKVVHLSVPSFHSRRATFTVAPGTYAFRCTLHTDMKGTLTVQ
jgi:plastocyanin